MSPGGPTMERSNRRNTISILHRSCLYTFLCAAPKQATGVTMASKYLTRSRIVTFLLTKKKLCAKDAFEAAWRWCVKSRAWLPVLAVQSMHPNHLCVEPRSGTSITYPFRRGTSLGLCDWVVKIFVFFTLTCSPTSAKHVTSSSKKNFVSSNVFAKKKDIIGESQTKQGYRWRTQEETKIHREVLHNRWCRFMVLGIMPAQGRARSNPASLGAVTACALVSIWSALFTHAAACSVAVSLLFEDPFPTTILTDPSARSSPHTSSCADQSPRSPVRNCIKLQPRICRRQLTREKMVGAVACCDAWPARKGRRLAGGGPTFPH